MRTGHVYVLYDVREPHHYKYVGRTVQTLHRRLWRHRRIEIPHLHVARWILKARRHNIRIMSLGEYPEDVLPFWESFWMETLREAGHVLTNVSPGGSTSGFPKGYYTHSPETLAKMRGHHNPAWLGKKRSQETKNKIRAGMLRAYAEGRH